MSHVVLSNGEAYQLSHVTIENGMINFHFLNHNPEDEVDTFGEYKVVGSDGIELYTGFLTEETPIKGCETIILNLEIHHEAKTREWMAYKAGYVMLK